MSVLPWREARPRTAEQRTRRAATLRRVLGPVDGWSEELKAELGERMAIAEHDGGVERAAAERAATETLRAELLRRLS